MEFLFAYSLLLKLSLRILPGLGIASLRDHYDFNAIPFIIVRCLLIFSLKFFKLKPSKLDIIIDSKIYIKYSILLIFLT